MNSMLWADVFLSDHWWILFDIIFPSDQAKEAVSVRWRSFHEETGETFSSVFPPTTGIPPPSHTQTLWMIWTSFVHPLQIQLHLLRSGLNVVLARYPGFTKTFTVWKDNAGGQKGDGRRWIFSYVMEKRKHERLLSMNRLTRRGPAISLL